MNGLFNVIACALLGAGIVGGAWIWTNRDSAEVMTPQDLAAFKEQVREEVQAEATLNCDEMAKACETDLTKFSDLEQPYASGVAVSNGASTETEMAAAQPTATSSDSFVSEPRTAVLAASFGGNDEEADAQNTTAPSQSSGTTLVDKPDTNDYFTENRTLRNGETTSSPTAGLIDKQDTQQYFTENRRTDGTRVDKPDDSQYFTEFKAFDDPCIRDDGSAYTGPGTASDPFAEGDPCLTQQRFAEQPLVDKYDDGDYYTEFTPFQDPCIRQDGSIYTGPGTATDPLAAGDPCLTQQQFAQEIPPYTFEEFEDPCKEGRMMPGNNDFLGEADPCVTDVRTPPEQFAEVPPAPQPIQTVPQQPTQPFQPSEPGTYTSGYTSPYGQYGPNFPRTTLGPRGSDYPRQSASC
ncbi:hypothetical protein [Parvularcula sp. IMCC14364]|uniref:hypothetical protein n=1 Tax=Parvularcula sp. IMCC14364 TaxID=3067902 RepID=UPI0027421BC9|nr:hypothetical protein [Parvularcula sp. IMCC14364]